MNLKSYIAERICGSVGAFLFPLSRSFAGALAVLVAVISMQGFTFAADKAAAKELSETPLFAFGGIGYAGIVSKGEVAFRNVFDSESAIPDFREILKTGSPQGQCYALLGLRIKDRATFEEEVKRFLASRQPVQTAAGCSLSTQPMSSVAASIRKGTYDAQATAKPRTR